MDEGSRRSMSARRAGLLLALAFALIGAGVTLFILFRGQTRTTPGGVPATRANIGKPSPPTPAPPEKQAGSGHARIEFASKNDPSKKAGEMEWTSLEPLEERGWSMITEPRAWVYGKDGRTIHIQAAKGRVYRTDQGREPESGRFEGSVIVRVFEARDGRPIDLSADRPSVLVYTDSLSFDLPKAEASTRDRVQVSTADLEFAGTGLLVVFNQVQGRLETLEIDKTEYLRVARSASKGAPGGAAAATTGAPEAPAASDATAPAVVSMVPTGAKETIYHALFADEVRLTDEKRTLAADNLEVWVRLVNNQLPAGAIGGVGVRASSPSPTQATPDATPGATPGEPPTPAPAPINADQTRTIAAASTATDIVLKWSGPLVVRPLEVAPAELADGNHLALRLTADKSGAVTFNDNEAGASGRAVRVDYAATKGDLILPGRGMDVTVNTRGGQTASVGRFEVNLRTGIAHIPGGGVLEDGDRRITWADQADLEFAMEGGVAGGALREAAFTGRVVAKDKRSSLGGDFMKATFAPTATKTMILSRLIVDGHAVGDVGEGGRLETSKLDVAFKPSADAKEADPTVLTATGKVTASKAGQALSADSLQTGLARAADGRNFIATDVTAHGSVIFTDPERSLSAAADDLRADVPAQTATLTGKDTSVSASVGKIASARIDLNGIRREISVPGPGTFTRVAEAKGGRARPGEADRAFGSEVTATWAGSMRFSDPEGMIECSGDVAAISGAGTLTVDALHGERLRIGLTPGEPAGRAGAPAEPKAKPAERQLLRADVFASPAGAEGAAAPPAIAERRRYVAVANEKEPRLEQFLRVSGGQIRYDATASTVSVPGKGEAAVYAGETIGAAEQRKGMPDARGATLFTWLGSMGMDLGTGVLDVRRSVTLFHRPLNSDPTTRIECERLEATVRAKADAGPADVGLTNSRGAELVKALARGAVYVESGGRKLIADLLSYNAIDGTGEASASEDNRITIFDDAKGTSVSARRMYWDMVRDRIEIKEPSPIVAPR